jgi:hypothetical protein
MTRGFLRFLRGNTIGLLALFIALGGTTYAATALPANSVGTKQLKKNAVTAAKIKKSAVTNAKIGANAVTSAKVKDDSLVGADINESTLGTVPSATNATNATTAANANQLGGVAPGAYQKAVRWALVNANGTIAAQSGGIVVEKFGGGAGAYFVDFGVSVLDKPVSATVARTDSHFPPGEVSAVPCGGGPNAIGCASVTHNNHNTLLINLTNSAGTQVDTPVYVLLFA